MARSKAAEAPAASAKEDRPLLETPEESQATIASQAAAEAKAGPQEPEFLEHSDDEEVEAEEAQAESTEPVDEEAGDDKSVDEDVQTQTGEPEGTFSADLVARASALGLADEDMQEFTPAELSRSLNLMEKKVFQMGQAPAPSTTTPAAPATEQPKAEGSEEEIPDLNPEIHDEDFVKVVKGTKGVVKALQARIEGLESALQTQNKEAYEERFDNWVNNLGEEFQDAVGQGTGREMDTKSAQYENRCKILESVNTLANGYQRTGKAIPSEKVLFNQALRLALGDTPKHKAVEKKLAERSRQFVSRPQSRASRGGAPGTKRAYAAVSAKMREMGIGPYGAED